MKKGYLVKNEKESRKVQNYLFQKGYRWSKILTEITNKYLELNKGEFCNIITFAKDESLDYFTLNTKSGFEKVSKTMKVIIVSDKKLKI